MNQDKGISIEIDGVYCPKCNDMHPTLMWHEKYEDYISETKHIDSIVRVCKKVGESICLDGARKNYAEYLQALEIDETKTIKNVLLVLR